MINNSDSQADWQSDRNLQNILTGVGQASYVWDIGKDSLHWSDNFFDLLGFVEGMDITSGRAFEKLLSAESPETRFGIVHSATPTSCSEKGTPYQCVYAVNANCLQSNVSVWLEDFGRWYCDVAGRPIRAEGVVRIINERRNREENLKRKTQYDDLTGLPNRRFLEERVSQIVSATVVDNKSTAFMLLSICDFECINDIYGFEAGDEVLTAIAGMLQNVMRENDLVARFSGAKFGFILNDCGSVEVFIAAQRVLDTIQNQVINSSKGPVSIRAAIGACLVPRHARKATDAVSAATQALAKAKTGKGFRVHIYDPDPLIIEKRRQKATMVARFVDALETGSMHLAFQPVVNSDTHRIEFHEVLIRMDAMDNSVIEDASFVRMAEDLGIVRIVDMKALDLALETLRNFPDAKISLNITHESLENPEWLSRLASGMQEIENGSQRLLVEITESQIPLDVEETCKSIRMIHDIGCKVAIDDFGAGYTSFAHLRDLGVDYVKIDGSFCRDLKNDDRNGVFLRSIGKLAKTFNVRTVVEWVEDAETAVKLKEWGFDCLQGSLFGMPLPVPPWEKQVKQSKPHETATG